MKLTGVVTACLFASSVLVGGLGATVPTVEAAAPTSVDCDIPAATSVSPAPSLESFAPKVPERILDTRIEEGGDGPVPEDCTLVVDMSDIGPDDLTAFALSVTVDSPESGFFTAFACADGRPSTSSVNSRPGIPTPNLVIVSPDASGQVCIYSLRGGDVIVDVSGWWAPGPNRFRPIDPVRVEDTRESLPIKLPAENVRAIDVGGVAVPADAVSVTVNVAAVDTEGGGFLVIYPCGIPTPLASNVNFVAGEIRAVAAVVELGRLGPAKGKLCVSASQDLHVVVDVTGYDAPVGDTGPDVVTQQEPGTRIVDTRTTEFPGQRFTAGTVQRFDLGSVVDRPDDAVGAVLNVVAVNADRPAFLTVFPCTDDVPFIASVNHDRGDTANLVVTALDEDTAFCVYAEVGIDVVIDLVGVHTGPEDSLLNELTLRVPGTAELVSFDQAFTVDGADYTIRCNRERTLLLRLGLAPGVVASVNAVEIELPADAADPDLAVTIPDEGLLTVEVERGNRSDDYHVRCLPTDFPRLLVETPDGAAPVTPGWYMTEVGWNDAQSGHYLAIFDGRGVPVWFRRATEVLIDTKLLSTGDLVTSPITGTGFGIDPTRGHLVLALDGDVALAERLSEDAGSPADHHDYIEIPSATNDRRAIVSYPRIDAQDLSGLRLPPPGGANCAPTVVGDPKTVVGGEILEVGGTSPAWTWDMTEHFGYDESNFPQCFGNFPMANGGAGEVDPFHINSIDRILDPACEPTCDYLVSARHLDAVFRVNRSGGISDGDVEWILGTPPRDPVTNVVIDNASGAPRLTFPNDPLGGPLRPHDARMSGNIVTLHDNRAGSGLPSRAVAYRVDAAAGTATLLWQIDHPEGLNNPSLGSTRITDDDTVLVGWGQVDPLFSEHAIADGAELARWTRVDSAMTAYRIVKYPAGTFDADVLRAAAGGTIAAPIVKPGAMPAPDPFPM